MLRVALTGGIATGKTHVLARLRALGVPTVDADELVHAALVPGSPAAKAIARSLGHEMLEADGGVNRKVLGRRVFGDPEARRTLEGILHPQVYASIDRWFKALAAERATLGVADIPLLFETRHEADFDVVIVTACDAAEQLSRVMRRDGLSEEEARSRIAAQLPIEEKIERASVVIWTRGTHEDTDRQVDEVVRQLRDRSQKMSSGR